MHKLNFEKLNSEFPIYRAPVPGGWFLVCVSASKTMPIAMASGGTFVADPLHSWDGCDYSLSLEDFPEDTAMPTVDVFNTKSAIDFAMESGAGYSGRSHAYNSLRKLKRDLFATGVDTQDPCVLAEKWYNYVLDVKGGKDDTRYNAEGFVKKVIIA